MPTASDGNVWRTDAAALLAMMVKQVDRDTISIHWIKDCLDKHGYLRPNGEIDTHAAKIQIESLYEHRVWDKVAELAKEGF